MQCSQVRITYTALMGTWYTTVELKDDLEGPGYLHGPLLLLTEYPPQRLEEGELVTCLMESLIEALAESDPAGMNSVQGRNTGGRNTLP